ncbi:MAG: DUF58 domain-containing protein [Anaerolineae bacterium]|nr:DUF58 domain-containing protein [Anaerolineae bacterium]
MKNSRILFLLLFLISFFGAFATNAPVYVRLLYLTSLIIGGSWLWVKLSISGLRLIRRSRSLRANVGDIYDEYFEVHNNNRWLCPWIEIHNETDLPASAGSRLLGGIKKREKRSYLARTWLVQRGAFSLGPTTLISRDPLGVFLSQKSFSAESELIVLPLLLNLTSFPDPPGLLSGGKVLRQKSLGITPHAAGVREYAPGDALRRIHWATSARRQKLMVKEFDQDPQSSVWIFLDAESAAQISQKDYSPLEGWDNWMLGHKPEFDLPPSTFEYAVTSAASLTHYFTKARRAVGLIVAGQKSIVIPADRSTRQEEKILETLAFIQSTGELSMEALVATQAGQLPQGSSAVLITASVRPEIMHAVDDLLRRNQRPTVVLLDAESFGSEKSNAALVESLRKINVPVCRVLCGDDLEKALSNISGTTSTKENFLWREPFTP